MAGKLMNEDQKQKYDFCLVTLANFLREVLQNLHYCLRNALKKMEKE